MEASNHLILNYDRIGDILYVDVCKPYAAQESDDIGDEIVARRNPVTGAIENLEILFFSRRLKSGELTSLPEMLAELLGAKDAAGV